MGGKAVCEVLELGVGRSSVLDRELGQLVGRRAAAATRVDDEPGGDRQHPGAEMLAVLEARIRTQRAQERLLEGVLGRVGPDAPPEEAEHDVPVLDVEALEGRDRGHCLHILSNAAPPASVRVGGGD